MAMNQKKENSSQQEMTFWEHLDELRRVLFRSAILVVVLMAIIFAAKDIVFDSDVHDWSLNTSELNERIIGKKQIVFLIEDENGEIFGHYLDPELEEDMIFDLPKARRHLLQVLTQQLQKEGKEYR